MLAVIWVNIILSMDNAVVIALAVRSLTSHQRNIGLVMGATAIVAARIALTVVAVMILNVPFLRLIGAILLSRIAGS